MKRDRIMEEIESLEAVRRRPGHLNPDQLARACAALDALRWVIGHPGASSPALAVLQP